MKVCLGAAVARLVKEVFDTAAGLDAVNAVLDYLRSQRVTSLADLQVHCQFECTSGVMCHALLMLCCAVQQPLVQYIVSIQPVIELAGMQI